MAFGVLGRRWRHCWLAKFILFSQLTLVPAVQAQVCESLVQEPWDSHDYGTPIVELAGYLERQIVQRLRLPSYSDLFFRSGRRSGEYGNGYPGFDLDSLGRFMDSLVTHSRYSRGEMSEAVTRLYYLRASRRPPFATEMFLDVLAEGGYPTDPMASAVGDLRNGFSGRFEIFQKILEGRALPNDSAILAVSRLYCQIRLLEAAAEGTTIVPSGTTGFAKTRLRRWLLVHRQRLSELLGCEGDCLGLDAR